MQLLEVGVMLDYRCSCRNLMVVVLVECVLSRQSS